MRRLEARVHLILMTLWIVVGLPVSWWLRASLPWIVFLSVYAIIATHWAGIHAERADKRGVSRDDRADA